MEPGVCEAGKHRERAPRRREAHITFYDLGGMDTRERRPDDGELRQIAPCAPSIDETKELA